MNNFTVSEAKDALISHHDEFSEHVEARKFIYRQLTRSIERGLIKRTDSSDKKIKKVIYSKTDLFFNSSFLPTKRLNKVKIMNYKHELQQELLIYEIDLNTVLEEAKEYKHLSCRFPELQEELQLYQSQAEKDQ